MSRNRNTNNGETEATAEAVALRGVQGEISGGKAGYEPAPAVIESKNAIVNQVREAADLHGVWHYTDVADSAENIKKTVAQLRAASGRKNILTGMHVHPNVERPTDDANAERTPPVEPGKVRILWHTKPRTFRPAEVAAEAEGDASATE